MNIRYVITMVNKDGDRTLALPCQGRYTFETEREAQQHLNAILSNNSTTTLRRAYGDPSKMAVRAVDCWDGHNDPKSIWFDLPCPHCLGRPVYDGESIACENYDGAPDARPMPIVWGRDEVKAWLAWDEKAKEWEA